MFHVYYFSGSHGGRILAPAKVYAAIYRDVIANADSPWRWNMNQTPIIAPAAEILPQTSSRTVQPPTPMSVRCRGTSRGALLFTLLLLHTILAITALGQEYRGLIIGSVTDPTGAVTLPIIKPRY